jgi:hypothetical protein
VSHPLKFAESGAASVDLMERVGQSPFKNASDVESQEPCIHPSLSDTARADAFLRCS